MIVKLSNEADKIITKRKLRQKFFKNFEKSRENQLTKDLQYGMIVKLTR